MQRGLAILWRDLGARPRDLSFVDSAAVGGVGGDGDWWLVIITIFGLFGDRGGHAVGKPGRRGLLWFSRAIGVIFFENDHPGPNLIFAAEEGGEVDPFIRTFFVLMGDPEGFGGDFAALDECLGELIANAGVDAEFVHDEAVDDSWTGQGWGGEEDAEGGVGTNKEELWD